jgi:tetratricopeptide (TPR) repeat protein
MLQWPDAVREAVVTRTSAIGAVAIWSAFLFASSASAQTMSVFGGGRAEACWRAAFVSTTLKMDSAVEEARWKADAIGFCDDALSGSVMDMRDRAATYVNRGILEMSRENYGVAENNFQSALTMIPKLAEAHVNLGSTLINMKRYEDGVKETELGLSLKSKEPERGYYNLGIAYERLGNAQKAYESYRQASVLAPTWQDPKDELTRFTVEPVKK